MKTIRFLAASLMVITGVLHVLPMFSEVKDPNALPMLGFGVIYLVTGILLFSDWKFAPIAGIIFPLIGLGVGFAVVGLKNWDTMLTIMFLIDAVVMACSLILFTNRHKVRVVSHA